MAQNNLAQILPEEERQAARNLSNAKKQANGDNVIPFPQERAGLNQSGGPGPSGGEVIDFPQSQRLSPEQQSDASRGLKTAKAAQKGGAALKRGGQALETGGAVAEKAGKAGQAAAKAGKVASKGLEKGGDATMKGGQAMMKAGAGLSQSGVGAIAGVPLMALGGATTAGGAGMKGAGKAGALASKLGGKASKGLEKGGQAAKKTGKKAKETGEQVEDAGKLAEQLKARQDMGAEPEAGGIPGIPKGLRPSSPKLDTMPGKKGVAGRLGLGKKGKLSAGDEKGVKNLMRIQKKSAAENKKQGEKEQEIKKIEESVKTLAESKSTIGKIKAGKDLASAATKKVGTGTALQFTWGLLLDLLSGVGAFVFGILGLIYINIHFCMKYIFRSERFCKFGEEKEYSIFTMAAKAGAAGGQGKIAAKAGEMKNKVTSSVMEIAEMMGLAFFDILILVILSLALLILISPILVGVGIYSSVTSIIP